MKAIKAFFSGVNREAKRVRWPKTQDMKSTLAVVFGYVIFFGLFMVLTDYLIIRLLQFVNFS